tara:strand:+ start:802 stop:1020 length:219 start_codon:yes stop_codon:yes gene_type:complete
MIMINELVRLNTNEKGYPKGKWGLIQNISEINTADKLKGKCTWICHNDTNYCKENHVIIFYMIIFVFLKKTN